jgi:protein phosphatase methylesterase 1
MSFAALSRFLKNQYTVVAFDFRGHGENSTDNETDLSEETLIQDTIEVVKYISQ